MSSDRMKDIEARNKKTVATVFGVVFAMVALAYISVPLYNLFCKVTGFNGTTSIASTGPERVLDRQVSVRLLADTARNMPWSFAPEADKFDLKIGEEGFVNFVAYNPTAKPIAGTAIYNVTPLKAGKYFKKIQCFCFDEQVLTPGQKMNMPVVFFADPKIDDDPNLKDVKTITLSYTFFRKDSSELESAIEDYNNVDLTDTRG